MIDALELGARIVATAQRFDGACACAGKQQSIFAAVGFPFDIRPFRAVDGKCIGMSTCYIFALNVLRLSGIALPAWHVGEPIGRLIAWASQHRAWQEPGDGLTPGPGDVLIIGPLGGTHVAVVVDCDGTTLTTIDGGQVCRRTTDGHEGIGRQMVAARERVWSVDRAGRDPVVGWVVCGLCPLA